MVRGPLRRTRAAYPAHAARSVSGPGRGARPHRRDRAELRRPLRAAGATTRGRRSRRSFREWRSRVPSRRSGRASTASRRGSPSSAFPLRGSRRAGRRRGDARLPAAGRHRPGRGGGLRRRLPDGLVSLRARGGRRRRACRRHGGAGGVGSALAPAARDARGALARPGRFVRESEALPQSRRRDAAVYDAAEERDRRPLFERPGRRRRRRHRRHGSIGGSGGGSLPGAATRCTGSPRRRAPAASRDSPAARALFGDGAVLAVLVRPVLSNAHRFQPVPASGPDGRAAARRAQALIGSGRTDASARSSAPVSPSRAARTRIARSRAEARPARSSSASADTIRRTRRPIHAHAAGSRWNEPSASTRTRCAGTSRRAASRPCASRSCSTAKWDREALLGQALKYPESNGSRVLRERIALFYPGATADNVLVTTG